MKKIKNWLKSIFGTKKHNDRHPVLENTGSKLPPQERQRRLRLLRNSSDFGSPFGRFTTLPTEYFRKRH